MSDFDDIEVGTRPRRQYTVVYHDLLPPDGALSARAYGVFVYLLTRPPGWKARAVHLCTVFSEGRNVMRDVLDELVLVGLLEMTVSEDPAFRNMRRFRYELTDVDVPRVWDATNGCFAPLTATDRARPKSRKKTTAPAAVAGAREADSRDAEVRRPEDGRADARPAGRGPLASREVPSTGGTHQRGTDPAGTRPRRETAEDKVNSGTNGSPPAGHRSPGEVANGIAHRWVDHPRWNSDPVADRGRSVEQLRALLIPYTQTFADDPATGYTEAELCAALMELGQVVPPRPWFDRTVREARAARRGEQPAGRPRQRAGSGALRTDAAWGRGEEEAGAWPAVAPAGGGRT